MHTKYVVMNEHTLGIVYEEQPNLLWPLRASVLRGAPWSTGHDPVGITELDTVRAASKDDFDDYRVCWEGHLS
jgi:hypothetical protein